MTRLVLDAAIAAAAMSAATRRDWHPWGEQTGETKASLAQCANALLTPVEIEGLLLHDWRANREITQLAQDLTREGIEVQHLPEWVDTDALASWIDGDAEDSDHEQLGLLGALSEWWAVGASYGGSLLIAVVDDGRPQSEPLDRARMRDLISWEVVDRWCCWPYRRGGLGAPVDYWVISPIAGQIARATQIVHPSRVRVHTGRWMPRRWRDLRDGWGPSRLELLISQRSTLARGHEAIGRLLRRTSQDVITVPELSEMIEAYGRPFVLDLCRRQAITLDSDGVLYLDGGIEADAAGGQAKRSSDKFESVARPLGGAPEIAQLQHDDWRRGWAAPSVVADGDAAAGLNGGAEAGPWRAWAAQVKALFKRELLATCTWQLGIVFGLREGPTRGRVPETWTVEPRPIAEPDHKLEAEIDEIETRTDTLAAEHGLLKDKEIRGWRNVDGKRGRVRVESADLLPEPGTDDVAGELAAAAGAGEVQQQALNGAQIQALFDLSLAVTAGTIPSEVARWLVQLAVPGLDTAGVSQAMAVAERWTNPKAPAVPEQPAATALDCAARFVQVFDVNLDADARADGATPVLTAWCSAIATRLDSHDYPAAGVFVRVPDALAVQFPYKPQDTSPPHCTVLYIGATAWDQVTKVREVVAKTAQVLGVLPCRARFGALNYFEKPNGSRVAWVAVEFEPTLDEYHVALREQLMAEGVMVAHRNDWWYGDGRRQDGPWVAHATLAYLDAGESYTGPVPVGEWTVERFEVWHGER